MLRIRRERLQRGWNQTQLAARANMSTTEVSRIETGRAIPHPNQVLRLARALKIPPDELLEPVAQMDGEVA